MNTHIIENVEYGIGDEVKAQAGNRTYYFTIGSIDAEGFTSTGMYIYMQKNMVGKRYPHPHNGIGFFPFHEYKISLMNRKR